MILGVTNPFFAKTLQHWPHIIRIGEMSEEGNLLLVEEMEVKHVHVNCLFTKLLTESV